MTARTLNRTALVTTPLALPDAEAWAAIVARDHRLDGRFVYGVRTTGVYCRPGCGSRRPRREHVEFFATPDAASRAGYRPCRRCRPADASMPALAALERARALLDTRPDTPPSLQQLASAVGLSPGHLQRSFRRAFGVSPKQYVLERRAARFRTSLRRSASVTDAQYDAGYSAPSRAQAGALAHLGMAPSAYQKGGHGIEIRYSIRDTEFGALLVASTPRGVCRVALGDSPAALASDLAREFPHASRRDVTAAKIPGDGSFLEWIDAILAGLDGRPSEVPVPIDVAATAFQRRVWRALQQIPYGQTRTYSAIAKSIGKPDAVRAVARACATNPVALVVPCHRVVPASGGAGGYRWGAKRKARLLKRERQP
jgi:AraC family transcriptional regulator, regulatory protein of adaptative response / methylated-DNA-[protein]-cysteine methyltransferase